ncbi:MAG: type II secretion system minor pseudopilin GspJ [Gammaproteobacteria bacterium]
MTRARGFTLIELLVAMTVLAVMAALAYGGLNGLIRQYQQTDDQVAQMVALQRTLVMLGNDLLQVQPRSVREEFHGDRAGALVADEVADFPLAFTRGGWSNPAQRRRTSLQRVGWRLHENRIERAHWQLVDRAQGETPVITPLVDGVEALEWRFRARDGQWLELWPPADDAQASPSSLPTAVEVTLVLENGEQVLRVFALNE